MATIEEIIGPSAIRDLAEFGYEVVLRPSGKVVIPWACPKCKATVDSHGQRPCAVNNSDGCSGFVCECDFDEADTPDHGNTYDTACKEAHCYHCGWCGVFPKPPGKAAPWEKKALDAGWAMPESRKKELGL